MSELKLLKGIRLNILRKMCENQNLCKLVYYNDYNPLSKDDIKNPFELLFLKNIFPLPYFPKITDEAKTTINVTIDNIKTDGYKEYLRNATIKVVIACHKNLWLMEDEELRPELIAIEIDNMLNNQTSFGLGKCKFLDLRTFVYNVNIIGVELTYASTIMNNNVGDKDGGY